MTLAAIEASIKSAALEAIRRDIIRAPYAALECSRDLPEDLVRDCAIRDPSAALRCSRDLPEDLVRDCAILAPSAALECSRDLPEDAAERLRAAGHAVPMSRVKSATH